MRPRVVLQQHPITSCHPCGHHPGLSRSLLHDRLQHAPSRVTARVSEAAFRPYASCFPIIFLTPPPSPLSLAYCAPPHRAVCCTSNTPATVLSGPFAGMLIALSYISIPTDLHSNVRPSLSCLILQPIFLGLALSISLPLSFILLKHLKHFLSPPSECDLHEVRTFNQS